MLQSKRKHLLPSYHRLSKFSFDIERLKAEVLQMSGLFKNVIESNKELCANNHELVATVYDHYEQVSLTTFNGPASENFTEDTCAVLGETAGTDEVLSKHRKYKLKLQRRTDFPQLDERNYNSPTSAYTGSYIEECIQQFGCPVMRVRLVKLKAGEKVDWHIDYDPSYATRIIIPVITNPGVVNLTKRKGVIEEKHLEADGSPWFLNTGYSHSVENRGSSDRIVLMCSLEGHSILDDIAREYASSFEGTCV